MVLWNQVHYDGDMLLNVNLPFLYWILNKTSFKMVHLYPDVDQE